MDTLCTESPMESTFSYSFSGSSHGLTLSPSRQLINCLIVNFPNNRDQS